MDASGFKELHQVVSTHCAKAREYPTGRECNCPIGDPANGGSILNWPVHQTCSEHQIVFMKEHGLNATNIGPYGGGYAGHCAMSAAPSAGQFKSLAAAQQPGLMLYNYSADEIGHCTNIYPTIQQWAQNMHQAGIKNLITMSPNPALYSDGSGSGRSAVDIWVLLPLMYNNSKSEVNRVLQKGDSVWSYNTLVQDAYS